MARTGIAWPARLIAAFAVLTLASTGIAACTVGGDPEPLQARFGWDFDPNQTEGTACSFSSVQFFDESTGEPTRRRWDFPNGTSSTRQDPVYGMEDVPGDVTLTVWRGEESDSITERFFPDHC